jgi:hypothetical protein
MYITERQKWDTRHIAGAVLSGMLRKIDGKRRHEVNDTMVAAAARMDSVAGWLTHVAGRFDINLEEVYVTEQFRNEYSGRLDVLVAKMQWDALREVVEENPALVTLIARDGPLPDDLRPEETEEDKAPTWTMPIPSGELIPVPSLRTIWTSQSEMTHGADSRHGNVILFRREPLTDLLTGRLVRAPFISGNSIRHSWRELAVNRLYMLTGLEKQHVQTDLHHALTSGGTIDAGSEMSKVDPGLRRAVRHLFPAFELLGGIVEKQVCHGAWNVHDAILVCRENVSRLMHQNIYPPPKDIEHLAIEVNNATGNVAKREARVRYAKALSEHLRPALSYLTLRQYTKHVDPDVALEGDNLPGDRRAKRHMLYDTEVVGAGAQWVHFCTVHKTATEFARSCVADILEEFQDHPYLAAGNNKGHGLVSFDGYLPSDGAEPLPSPKLYLEHLKANKQTIIDWLTSGKINVEKQPLSLVDEKQTKKGKGR